LLENKNKKVANCKIFPKSSFIKQKCLARPLRRNALARDCAHYTFLLRRKAPKGLT
jgi:hypothetical protein